MWLNGCRMEVETPLRACASGLAAELQRTAGTAANKSAKAESPCPFFKT